MGHRVPRSEWRLLRDSFRNPGERPRRSKELVSDHTQYFFAASYEPLLPPPMEISSALDDGECMVAYFVLKASDLPLCQRQSEPEHRPLIGIANSGAIV